MKFSRYAVAYLDLLGFSKFVESAEDNNKHEKLNILDKLFNEIIPSEISIDGKNSSYPVDLKLRCLSCSDSIFVTAPVQEKSNYPALVAVLPKKAPEARRIRGEILDRECQREHVSAVANGKSEWFYVEWFRNLHVVTFEQTLG